MDPFGASSRIYTITPGRGPKIHCDIALTLNLSTHSQLRIVHIKMQLKKIYFRKMLKNKNTMWKY